MAIAGMMAAPILGGLWTGFSGPMTSGFVLPAYSVFPLGYAEITRVMLKANLVRAVTWAPLAIVYAVTLAHRQGSPFEYGALIGLDVVLILIALQPITIMGHFSAGTNDTDPLAEHTVLQHGPSIPDYRAGRGIHDVHHTHAAHARRRARGHGADQYSVVRGLQAAV